MLKSFSGPDTQWKPLTSASFQVKPQHHIHSKVRTHFWNNVLWWNIGRLSEGQCCIYCTWRMGQCAHSGGNTGGVQKLTDVFRCVCTQRFIPYLHFVTCVTVNVNTALFVSRNKTNCAMTFVQQLQYLLSHPGKMLDGKFNVFLMFSFDHRDISPHAKACHSTTGK